MMFAPELNNFLLSIFAVHLIISGAAITSTYAVNDGYVLHKCIILIVIYLDEPFI